LGRFEGKTVRWRPGWYVQLAPTPHGVENEIRMASMCRFGPASFLICAIGKHLPQNPPELCVIVVPCEARANNPAGAHFPLAVTTGCG